LVLGFFINSTCEVKNENIILTAHVNP